MRRGRLLSRGWAQALVAGYTVAILVVMLVAAGLPRF
jgi:hypothetical protein